MVGPSNRWMDRKSHWIQSTETCNWKSSKLILKTRSGTKLRAPSKAGASVDRWNRVERRGPGAREGRSTNVAAYSHKRHPANQTVAPGDLPPPPGLSFFAGPPKF